MDGAVGLRYMTACVTWLRRWRKGARIDGVTVGLPRGCLRRLLIAGLHGKVDRVLAFSYAAEGYELYIRGADGAVRACIPPVVRPGLIWRENSGGVTVPAACA